jgi:hypothetical protein
MTVTRLEYFRVTCDEADCDRYINIACEPDNESVGACLQINKWSMQDERHDTPRPFGKARCPEHTKETA